MLTEFIGFFSTNWPSILITLVGGAIFYFLPNYTIKNYIYSAEKDRTKQAKNALLDILESRVINKQEISFEKINNLMDAISREYSVVLSDITTSRCLLQDLELIFEKSHHLDSSQKDEYCKQIEGQIIKIDETNEKLKQHLEIPKDYLGIFEKLSEEIKFNDSTNAQKTLLVLKDRLLSGESLKTKKSEETAFVDLISTFIMISMSYLLYKYVTSENAPHLTFYDLCVELFGHHVGFMVMVMFIFIISFSSFLVILVKNHKYKEQKY